MQSLTGPSGYETPDVHSSSQEYSRRFAGSAGRWFLDVQEAATEELLHDIPPGTVLDVGGGHGQSVSLLLRLGHRVTVLGSDTTCSEQIRPLVEAGRVGFQTAPLTRLPYEAQTFDVVMSYRILAHLDAWRELVGELARVARRTVVVEFPVETGFGGLAPRLFRAKRRVERTTRPYTQFDEDVVNQEFGAQGLHSAGRRAQFFWPMVLHRMHGRARVGSALEWAPRALGLTRRLGSPVIARFDRKAD